MIPKSWEPVFGQDHAQENMSIKLRYFAWVRERVGKPEEDVEVPAGIATVGELMVWLASRGEEYAYAFENPKVIRAAIDRAHVEAAEPDRRGAGNRLFPADDGRIASRQVGRRRSYIIAHDHDLTPSASSASRSTSARKPPS